MFRLLPNAKAFESYQQQWFDEHHEIPGLDYANWGSGPSSYPCLVDCVFLPPAKVACCFVYPDDARELLAALPAQRPARALDQDNYNRQNSAVVLAVVRLLVDTGITTEPQFLALLNHYLASVDQWAQEDHEILRAEDESTTRGVMTRFYPEPD